MKRLLVALTGVVAALGGLAATYEANWASLDTRPTPSWWQDAKFGIFVHWGPYAVPAFAPTADDKVYECYSEWYHGRLLGGKEAFAKHHAEHYGKAPYGNFAAAFKAENFNPAAWAELFRKAGAKYTVLTSKHHDGYALWPSPESAYFNAVALGSGRDLAGEFTAAMKAAGLKSGFYFSLLEYANPLYPNNYLHRKDVKPLAMKDWARTVNLPQMKELVERYHADIIWPDGEWDYSDADHLSEEFLAWLYNDSCMKDSVVVNDRWGKACRGKHGGHYTTEYAFEGGDQAGLSAVHPWEECRGIGRSFGYNRFETAEQYMSREKCVETLVQIVSGGGNLLLNVGPTADGRIPAIMQDRLLAIGRWLKVNGEAIYATRRAKAKAVEKRVYVTAKGDALYAVDFRLDGKPFTVKGVGAVAKVALVGSDAPVAFAVRDDAVTITPPALAPTAAPCECAWAYRLSK